MDHKATPTVRDSTKFDIENDTAALRKAMKGLGTDEQVIINILTAISNDQRQQLLDYYNRTLERDLMEDLKGDLSGNFRNAIKALMKLPNEYLCKHIKKQLKQRFNLDNLLTEILFPRSKEEIAQIVACFGLMSQYSNPLREEVHNKAGEDFRAMFELMLEGVREPAGTVDEGKATKQAEELIAAKDLHPAQEVFYRLLAQASFAQLRLVFAKYKELSGDTVGEAVKRRSIKGAQSCLYSLVHCVESTPGFFAKRLHKAMESKANDNATLIRIIVSRSEIDLANIKDEYECLYKTTLLHDISVNTSGDYKLTLCAIIGA